MNYSDYFWQGEKVRLRPLKPEDAELCFADQFDSPSRRLLQLGIELPSTLEQQKQFIEKYGGCKDVDGIIIFAIDNLEGTCVGGISLHSRHEKNGNFSMGLSIRAEHRRKGYAEDAARILMKYCFHERRYEKCNSACVQTNEASVGLHKKLGFVEEGCRRRHLFLDGKYHDSILYGLTREEFDHSQSG